MNCVDCVIAEGLLGNSPRPIGPPPPRHMEPRASGGMPPNRPLLSTPPNISMPPPMSGPPPMNPRPQQWPRPNQWGQRPPGGQFQQRPPGWGQRGPMPGQRGPVPGQVPPGPPPQGPVGATTQGPMRGPNLNFGQKGKFRCSLQPMAICHIIIYNVCKL